LDVRGGGEQVKLKDGVAIMAEGAECTRDWTVAQFDIPGLSHDAISIGDGEVRETAVILLEALRAFAIRLT
jgi:hypothetical protein